MVCGRVVFVDVVSIVVVIADGGVLVAWPDWRGEKDSFGEVKFTGERKLLGLGEGDVRGWEDDGERIALEGYGSEDVEDHVGDLGRHFEEEARGCDSFNLGWSCKIFRFGS